MKSVENKLEKHILVAASEKCYLISTGPSFFVFYIQPWSTILTYFVNIVDHDSTTL